MNEAEKKEFAALEQKVNEQAETIKALNTSLEAATENIAAPEWFVQEFGSGDLGGLLNDPKMTKEGWRNITLALRAQGFGSGRGKSVNIK